MLVLPA